MPCDIKCIWVVEMGFWTIFSRFFQLALCQANFKPISWQCSPPSTHSLIPFEAYLNLSSLSLAASVSDNGRSSLAVFACGCRSLLHDLTLYGLQMPKRTLPLTTNGKCPHHPAREKGPTPCALNMTIPYISWHLFVCRPNCCSVLLPCHALSIEAASGYADPHSTGTVCSTVLTIRKIALRWHAAMYVDGKLLQAGCMRSAVLICNTSWKICEKQWVQLFWNNWLILLPTGGIGNCQTKIHCPRRMDRFSLRFSFN